MFLTKATLNGCSFSKEHCVLHLLGVALVRNIVCSLKMIELSKHVGADQYF
jgi:hypothetical protein